MKKFIFAVAITLLATLSVTAQTGSAATTSSPAAPAGRRSITLPPAKANPVTIPKFDQPPTIDGRLDDAVWQKAAVLGDFYQVLCIGKLSCDSHCQCVVNFRYFLRKEKQILETPQFFWLRVAMGLALNEKEREKRAIEFATDERPILPNTNTSTVFELSRPIL